MKILLTYEPTTGIIQDKTGAMVATYFGLENCEFVEEQGKDIESLVTLKNAGFEVNEIIELNRKGLV